MKFTVQLNEADLHLAQKLHMRPRPALRRVLYALAVVYALMVVSFLYKGIVHGEWVEDVILALIVVALFVFFFRRALRKQISKSYQQQKSLRETYTIEFNPQGYFIEAPSGTTRLLWPDVNGWKAGDSMLLLYQSDLLFNVLPFRVVTNPGDKAAVLKLIESKLGAQKR